MSENIAPKICVVVPVFHRIEQSREFLASFTKSTYSNYVIVMTDDGVRDTVTTLKREYPQIIAMREKPDSLWWTAGTNLGVEYALENDFDYVLTINQDAVVAPDYLEKLVKCATTRPGAIWGSTILAESTGKVWAFGVTPNWPAQYMFNHNFIGRDLHDVLTEIEQPYEVEAINGDGTLIPVDIFRQIGMYDAKWMPQYHADTEFVMRARRHGFHAYICPEAILHNHDVATNSIKNAWQRLTSLRSDKHIKPVFKLYWSYAPLIYKLFFFWVYFYHVLLLPGKLWRKFSGRS